MENFNQDRLSSGQENLPPWKRVLFMVRCAQRMIPNYDRFSAETGFGEVTILRRALDAAWRWIESSTTPPDLAELRDACDQLAPDTERFRSPFASAALDAANSVAAILDALERPNSANMTEVSSLARDTVDLFVQESLDLDPNAPGFEERILEHDLMQRELRRQREDLELLTRWSGDRETAHELREHLVDDSGGSLDTVKERGPL